MIRQVVAMCAALLAAIVAFPIAVNIAMHCDERFVPPPFLRKPALQARHHLPNWLGGDRAAAEADVPTSTRYPRAEQVDEVIMELKGSTLQTSNWRCPEITLRQRRRVSIEGKDPNADVIGLSDVEMPRRAIQVPSRHESGGIEQFEALARAITLLCLAEPTPTWRAPARAPVPPERVADVTSRARALLDADLAFLCVKDVLLKVKVVGDVLSLSDADSRCGGAARVGISRAPFELQRALDDLVKFGGGDSQIATTWYLGESADSGAR